MRKISTTLTSIVLVIFISNISYIILSIIFLSKSSDDIRIVNYTGIVRGGIQRIAKREAEKENSDDLIKMIDDKLAEATNYRSKISVFSSVKKKYEANVNSIKSDWNDLKNMIYQYRNDPSQKNRSELFKESEILWDECNDLVFMVEKYSENKSGYFIILLFVVIINTAFISLIIYLIRKIIKDKLEYYAYYDFLTNCLNRRAFDETITKEIELAKRYNRIFSLILFDLDFFKKINDTYGHEAGDYVLKRTTKIINESIRSSDIFGRVGGEEFMIINFDNKLSEVKKFSERLRELVEKTEFKSKINVTISVGVTKFRGFYDTKEALFKRADKALYKAKYAGRNRVIFDF